MSQQGLLQQSIRDITGTELDFNGDWLALMASDSITTGSFNERLLAWINVTLGTSYTNLPEAQQAFAVDQGYTSWSHMGAIILATSGASELLGSETQGLAIDFTDDWWLADTGLYGSALVVDTGTPANDYDSHPYGLLTYTSPSAKMTLGPSGTLRFGAHNLCLRSEDFGSTWNISALGSVSTNNTTDPNGGSTADKLLERSATGQHYSFQTVSVVSGAQYAFTVYIKAAERSWVTVSQETSGEKYAYFDVSNGVVGTTAAATTASISDAGNGWWKCTVTATTASTSMNVIIYIASADGTNSYAGTNTNGLYVWGAHLRRTPSDDTYLATTSAARYALPFEWDSAGNNLGILVEEARTNLCLYSDDLTNAAWTKSNMTTAKTATGADGVANSATTCTATAGNATVLQSITSGSAARVQSCWIKRRTGTGNIDMTQDNGTTWATVTVTSSWTRVSIAAATVTNPIVGLRIVTSGDAVDVMLMQQEVGSFITSAIPTLGSTVTRAADNISLATSLFPLGSAHTLFAHWRCSPSTSYRGVPGALDRDGAGASSDDLAVDNGASGELRAYIESSGSLEFSDLTMGAYTASQTVKMAIAAAANNANAAAGGTLAGSDDTSVSLPTFTAFRVGAIRPSSGTGITQHLNSHIKQLMYLPRRMSNADMQTLTSA